MRRVGRRRDVLVLAAAEQGRERGQEAGRVAERPIRVQLELVQVLAQEDDHLGPAQHPKVRRQAELEGVLPDDPVAEGVERRDLRVRVAVRDELVHPRGHLVRRLVREREGQDLRRAGAPGCDQPGDPPGDDLGLAGARARDDEHRSITVGHGAPLVRVEPTEQGVHADGRGRRGEGRIHDADEFPPRRDLLESGGLAPSRSRPEAGHPGRLGSVGDGGHTRSIAAARDT